MLDQNKAMSICFKNDVFIYPVKYDNYRLKIEVNYAGRKKLGVDLYSIKNHQKKLSDKMVEMYINLAENMMRKEK